jgi:hypothetical protein
VSQRRRTRAVCRVLGSLVSVLWCERNLSWTAHPLLFTARAR